MKAIVPAFSAQLRKAALTSRPQRRNSKLPKKSTERNNGRFSSISQPGLFFDASSAAGRARHGRVKYLGGHAQPAVGGQPYSKEARLALGLADQSGRLPRARILAAARNRYQHHQRARSGAQFSIRLAHA